MEDFLITGKHVAESGQIAGTRFRKGHAAGVAAGAGAEGFGFKKDHGLFRSQALDPGSSGEAREAAADNGDIRGCGKRTVRCLKIDGPGAVAPVFGGHFRSVHSSEIARACHLMTQPVFLSADQATVLAAVIEERLALAAIHAFDLADKDCVVACGMFGHNFTGEARECVVQEWNAQRGPIETNTQARFYFRSLFALREMLGKRFLPFAEDAYAKAALGFQEREQPRILIDADKNQQRIEG